MDDRDNGKIADILKKVLTTGVTAATLTEEGVRAIMENAKNTKTDFVASVKNELRSYLDKIDLTKEIDKLVEKYDFEVKATISLKKKKKSKADESDE
jgi:fructose/tagatose bisphosphate aldolase